MENWIKKNREALGLSQAKLAAELGVGSSTVNAWEHGEKVPSAQTWPRGDSAHAGQPPQRAAEVQA